MKKSSKDCKDVVPACPQRKAGVFLKRLAEARRKGTIDLCGRLTPNEAIDEAREWLGGFYAWEVEITDEYQ